MSRLWARFAGLFSNRTLVGMDKAGNRYFARTEEMDGVSKWVVVIVLVIFAPNLDCQLNVLSMFFLFWKFEIATYEMNCSCFNIYIYSLANFFLVFS